MEDNKLPKKEQESIVNQVEDAIINEQNTLPYTPISKLPNLQTVVPLALGGETLAAQYKFKEEIPNVDEYLVEKLKYTSRIALANAFASEQADAVAFAIYQFERGKGLILADMAGIGKGRVNAGVLRYAYVNDLLPVFITEKPNLFSAIYRDIKDIGGLSTIDGKPYYGVPLIINGYKSGGFERTYDARGKLVRIKKPSETGIIDRVTGDEIITAPQQDEIKKIIKSGELPSKYDYVLLTYSQLGGVKGTTKVDYLGKVFEEKNRKVVIAMDEVHNAAGSTSDVGTSIQGLMSFTQGVLFSSATFSKRPDNMFLYALKTDIQDSPISTKELINVIKKGGERLTENLASNLVLSGQMLRREKTFDNCNVLYEYMSDENKESLFSKYDKAVKLYNKIESFFNENKNPNFAKAKYNAIQRFVKDYKIEVASPIQKNESYKEWKDRNVGKYYLSTFTIGEIKRLQFNFIETLLFALKADFVSNIVLDQIGDKDLENISTITKEVFLSNRKPIVAVRNTLEGVYASLGLEVGSIIDKADFSVYVYSIAKGTINGVIAMKEIKRADDKSVAKEFRDAEFEILDSDYEDGGESYKALLEEINQIDLEIPLSPIDYIIDKIETTRRPEWDRNFNQSPFYKVGEVTGRKFRLVKLENGKYELTLNTKDKNKASSFKKFNDGVYDVLIINESGSTGEDAHSSPQFKDTRPRVMVIHQVELDVNTEVQKRGRINRTGMVNYPTYIYAISRIPSEIRRLLMLSKKMRSLDANTTANQKQSSKLSQIQDKNGNPIEDIINKYGDVVLQEFVSSNDEYDKYMPSKDQEKLLLLSQGFTTEVFVRNLELATSDIQETFYDTINVLYLDYVKKEKEAGTYDLETEIKDLRASIKNRGIISKGANTSPFNSSVYEEDDYILNEDKPLTKEKVDELIMDMAKGQDPDTYYNNFLSDFQKHYKDNQIEEAKKSIDAPDYELAKDEQERKEMESEYELRIQVKLQKLEEEHEEILELLKALKPRRACLIPAILEECYELDNDGSPVVPKQKNKARFIGVKLSNGAKDKYSPMNIELVFCQLSGTPKLTLKPTKKGRVVLEWIKAYLDNGLSIVDIQAIETWFVDPNRRIMMRVLTGDILSAYSIALSRVDVTSSPYSKRIEFIKFTTADESAIRFGVRLFYSIRYIEIDPSRLPVTYPLNSVDFIEELTKDRRGMYVQIRNEDENIYITSRVRSNYGDVTLNVFGGTQKGAKGKKRKYFTEIFESQDFIDLAKSMTDRYYRNDFYKYYPRDSGRAVRLQTLVLPFIWYEDEQEIKDKALENIKTLFEYIYEKTPFNVTIQSEGGLEQIKDKRDTYTTSQDEEELEVEEIGVDYEYALAIPYEAAISKLNGFAKFKSYEKSDRGYGKVILDRRANSLEATSYSLYPLEPTPKTMIKDTLILFSDTEKINFAQELRTLINDGKSDVEIGLFIKSKVYGKVLSAKNIFGYYADDVEFVGNLFRDYAQGKIEDAKLPERKERMDEEEEIEVKPLTFDTAQDFMIELLSKTR
jgi:hypothetical protein